MDDFDESSSVPRPKPSKVPSWIMLGFLLGALFVWALPRPATPPAPQPPATPVLSAPPPATHSRFNEVEASFMEWQRYALWAGELSYVVMWDRETGTFRDCYEVLRRGDELFFRSVPRPKNLRVREDVPPNLPLQFLNPVPEEERGLFGQPITPPEMPKASN